MRKFKALIFVVSMLCGISFVSQAQNFSDIPEKVDYRDARVTDVGRRAVSLQLWAEEDPETHVVDTVLKTEDYVIWQSAGNIDEQIQRLRDNAPQPGEKRKATTTG